MSLDLFWHHFYNSEKNRIFIIGTTYYQLDLVPATTLGFKERCATCGVLGPAQLISCKVQLYSTAAAGFPRGTNYVTLGI